MLSQILSKSDCASCKFCCSFRRQSLWETPLFYEEDLEKIKKLFPSVKFIKTGASDAKAYTFDISGNYKTSSPEEEAPCPFLDSRSGCLLPAELKPFDCKIWPLRVVNLPKDNQPAVVLTPTCPAINKVPFEKVTSLAKGGIGKIILEYAKKHPQMIKEYSEFLSKIVFSFKEAQ